MKYIYLATEDELSEIVGKRLLSECKDKFYLCNTFRRGGFGYLKSSLSKFQGISNTHHLLLLTDLDRQVCASALISEWTQCKSLPEKFLFRVAVREIESWLLADHENIKRYFGLKDLTLPDNTDSLDDPKKTILKLAEKANRTIRNDLLPTKGADTVQGLGYNARLGDFALNHWNPERAATRSESLRRALMRLRQVAGSGN